MMVFWSGVVIALGLVIAIVWLPLVRRRWLQLPTAEVRHHTNVALYQQQIARAETQFADHAGQQKALDEFKQEAALTLLSQTNPSALSPWETGRVSFALPAMFTLFIVTVVAFGFVGFGQYQPSLAYLQQNARDPLAGLNIERIQDEIVSELHQRILAAPEDSDAWFLLGQRYLNSNAFDSALAVFDRVGKLRGYDANVIAAKATALYYQAGQRMTPQAQALIDQALTLDPNQITAQMLLASDFFLNAHYQQAIDIWQHLLDSNHPQVNRVKLIEAINMARMMR